MNYMHHWQLLRGAVKVRLSFQNGNQSGRDKVVFLFLAWVQERAPAWMNVEAEAYVVCRHLESAEVWIDGSIYFVQVQCTLNGARTLF